MACVPEWADVPLIGMRLMIEEPDLGEWGLCFWTSGFELFKWRYQAVS